MERMRIAIASGKGGTGKTFVATNLFWLASEMGMECVLADCDAEEPNVAGFLPGDTESVTEVFQQVPVIDPNKCTFCGKCYDYCAYNAILYLPEKRWIQVLPDLCHDCGACSYACEAGAITEKPRLLGKVKRSAYGPRSRLTEGRSEVRVYSAVAVIKKAIHEAGNKKVTILDSPPGISCPFIATVDKADYVVLVSEPTPFGLHDLKLSVSTVQQIGKPFGVVINKAGPGNREMYEWLKEYDIPLLMEIPFDREIARIYSDGGLLSREHTSYREMFRRLLKQILHFQSV